MRLPKRSSAGRAGRSTLGDLEALLDAPPDGGVADGSFHPLVDEPLRRSSRLRSSSAGLCAAVAVAGPAALVRGDTAEASAELRKGVGASTTSRGVSSDEEATAPRHPHNAITPLIRAQKWRPAQLRPLSQLEPVRPIRDRDLVAARAAPPVHEHRRPRGQQTLQAARTVRCVGVHALHDRHGRRRRPDLSTAANRPASSRPAGSHHDPVARWASGSSFFERSAG